jgi:hypothetical protein
VWKTLGLGTHSQLRNPNQTNADVAFCWLTAPLFHHLILLFVEYLLLLSMLLIRIFVAEQIRVYSNINHLVDHKMKILHILLLLVLSASSFATEILSRKTDENGYEMTVFLDGKTIMKKPDGTIWTKYPGGKIILKEANGKTMVRGIDGVVAMTTPDGEVMTTYPDGRTVTEFTNGEKITRYPDGKTMSKLTDGMIVTNYPDGKSVYTYTDGVITTEFPDGNVQTMTPGKGTILETPSGRRYDMIQVGDSYTPVPVD